MFDTVFNTFYKIPPKLLKNLVVSMWKRIFFFKYFVKNKAYTKY